jgi:hypothetical protein
MINFLIPSKPEAIALTFQEKLDRKDSTTKEDLPIILISNAAQLLKRKLKSNSKV